MCYRTIWKLPRSAALMWATGHIAVHQGYAVREPCPAMSRLFTVWNRRGTVERDRHRRRNRRVLARPARHGAWPRSHLLPDSPHYQTGGCAERWSGPGPPSAVTARSPADLQRRPGSVGRSADRSVLTGSPGQQRAAARRPDSAASDPG